MGMNEFRQRKWVRRTAEVALFAAILFGISAYQKRTMVEGPAPALGGSMLSGSPFDLAGARNKPVVVYFWATWCPVCRAEEGTIAALVKDHDVITVAMQSGDAAAVEAHLRERDLGNLPVLVDETGDLAARWGVRGVPATFIVDDGGAIRFREMGYTTGVGLRLRLWWASVTG